MRRYASVSLISLLLCSGLGIAADKLILVGKYEGGYVPTEIDGQNIAVFPRSRLATTWAALKARPGLRNETVESHSLK